MSKIIRAADLFCGAGGTSTGLKQAADAIGARVDLTAINHWDLAIETHSRNHADARHICESLESVDARKVIPGGKLDVLWASPECVHHSNARGGKPMSDQSRATAWHVLRWAEALRPRWIGVENVREFLTWGPLGSNGRPLKSKRGDLFSAWVSGLRALGYTVDWKVLNAADYGAATTRRRLFVVARLDGGRARGPIPWPLPTHAPVSARGGLFEDLLPWRAAREVIDWSLRGSSIFNRKKPLSEKTIARIAEGLRRFGGAAAEPFLLQLTHGGRLYDTKAPFPTFTGAHRGEMALVEPFVLGQQSGSVARSVRYPLPTLATDGAVALVAPAFLVPNYGEREGQSPRTHSLDDPLPAIVGTPQHAVVQPFLVPYYGTGVPDSVEEPIAAITTKDRFGLVEPVMADILFRMLQPHECAQGQGFPVSYSFAGNRGDVMKQIGNAVEVNQARALMGTFVEDICERRVA